MLEHSIDRLVDGRFSAGFWLAQENLPEADRLPAFLNVEAARFDPALFQSWFRIHRPDVVFTLHTVVREWLSAIGVEAPRDIGLVQLERRRGCADWSGLEQHNDLTGEAAVDMLVSMLHYEEPGIPAYPRATLVGASWEDGATTRALPAE